MSVLCLNTCSVHVGPDLIVRAGEKRVTRAEWTDTEASGKLDSADSNQCSSPSRVNVRLLFSYSQINSFLSIFFTSLIKHLSLI